MSAPIEIQLDRQARTLTLVWPSGERQPLDAAQLRRRCPCAECRRKGLLGERIEPAVQIGVDQLQPMGYGVQISFSDGHARGIYPWVYLSGLATEAADDGERPSRL